MDVLENAPDWLLRPVAVTAMPSQPLQQQIIRLAEKLPQSLHQIGAALRKVQSFQEYDPAANLAAAVVWRASESFFNSPVEAHRIAFLAFARDHMTETALARVCRRLAKDSSRAVRSRARKLIESGQIREVALPREPDGPWDATGWFRGVPPQPRRHLQGKRVWESLGLPPVSNLRELRELLGIRSPQQLGYFLLATDADGGPYTRFAIPKRDGKERAICAPKKQLRWVQRRILDQILAHVPTHPSAHGFVPGRSTVTNAEPHRRSALVIKFDLKDFFPTIHYARVLGVFANLGYYSPDGRFGTDDDSRRVAPTLARLCCYTPDSAAWNGAALPQGAPTSPALSNLACRRLDARLEGLARRNGGVYTRYADDLTFSFRQDGLHVGRFRWWVDQVCQQEGFVVNQSKFRVIRASQRQVVTGIVVNDVLRIPREDRRQFRAVLHNCRTDGIESQAGGRPGFAEYLRGFASYVHMVHPEEGQELLAEVDTLLGAEPDDGGSQ